MSLFVETKFVIMRNKESTPILEWFTQIYITHVGKLLITVHVDYSVQSS